MLPPSHFHPPLQSSLCHTAIKCLGGHMKLVLSMRSSCLLDVPVALPVTTGLAVWHVGNCLSSENKLQCKTLQKVVLST